MGRYHYGTCDGMSQGILMKLHHVSRAMIWQWRAHAINIDFQLGFRSLWYCRSEKWNGPEISLL